MVIFSLPFQIQHFSRQTLPVIDLAARKGGGGKFLEADTSYQGSVVIFLICEGSKESAEWASSGLSIQMSPSNISRSQIFPNRVYYYKSSALVLVEYTNAFVVKQL